MTETVLALLLERELSRRTGKPVRVLRLSDGSVFEKRCELHLGELRDEADVRLETVDAGGPVFTGYSAPFADWTNPEDLAGILDILEDEIRNPNTQEPDEAE